MQEVVNQNDKLVLDSRKRLQMSGVDAVEGFSEQVIKMSVAGKRVVVYGNNIKITAFNKSSGNLSADGNFIEIKYDYKKQPLFKRLFK